LRHSSIISTEAGLISGNLYKIPNRWFLPIGLYQTSCDAENLNFVDCNINRVLGSAIGLSSNDSIKSTLGEFFERYCAAFESSDRLIKGSFENLFLSKQHILHPQSLNYYAEWQYENKTIPYRKFFSDDIISWVEGKSIFTNEPILLPAFSVFLPHNRFFDDDKDYLLNTSTGVSAGKSLNDAVKGGFLECAEREAFSQFWYKQNQLLPQTPIYDSKLILSAFKANPIIQNLFDNHKVRIVAFDLSNLVSVETIVVFLYFKYKERIFQSMGAASRFNKEDAIIKATLEAYQGVEYAILVDKKENEWIDNKTDFSNVDDFSRHFAFYNRFPKLRKEVPILIKAENNLSNTNEIYYRESSEMMTSMAEIEKTKLTEAYYVELTTPDAKEAGYEVVRVITPKWSLLTGMHDRPFLGADSFSDTPNLFLNYPHPFP